MLLLYRLSRFYCFWCLLQLPLTICTAPSLFPRAVFFYRFPLLPLTTFRFYRLPLYGFVFLPPTVFTTNVFLSLTTYRFYHIPVLPSNFRRQCLCSFPLLSLSVFTACWLQIAPILSILRTTWYLFTTCWFYEPSPLEAFRYHRF